MCTEDIPSPEISGNRHTSRNELILKEFSSYSVILKYSNHNNTTTFMFLRLSSFKSWWRCSFTEILPRLRRVCGTAWHWHHSLWSFDPLIHDGNYREDCGVNWSPGNKLISSKFYTSYMIRSPDIKTAHCATTMLLSLGLRRFWEIWLKIIHM